MTFGKLEGLLTVVVILAMMAMVVAQEPAAKPIPATPDQQELIRAAVEVETAAAKEVQLARAQHQAAQARALQVIYSIMAELKLSPKEYGWRVLDGKLVFEKLPEKKQ